MNAPEKLSVPHMRGDEPHSTICSLELSKVFPTCVGMNRHFDLVRTFERSVPHMRGDEPP